MASETDFEAAKPADAVAPLGVAERPDGANADGANEGKGKAATLAEVFGIGRDGLEGLYGVARNDYVGGRYEQAVVGFELLCLYDHLNFDYWLALGRCRQMMRDYFAAGSALSVAVECAAAPAPDLLMDVAECMIVAEEPEAAEAALRGISDGKAKVAAGRLKLLRMSLDDLLTSRQGGDDG
ncbi:MAG: hypothetical protein OXJ53_13540 [Gammaproteobacteria bacterium]|nr:hypothetical protein [Gammaproteobacteria bacterium]MDE0273958.1 hypothetical protein [Gammaproteobacteria bacterium]